MYYFKYKDEKTELNRFDYSSADSSFNSLNFDEDADSAGIALNREFKTKELPSAKININKAGAEELVKLPGIGKITAGKILEYRKSIKAFSSINQLKNIKGISEVRFNKLKNYIVVQ